ncbi:hypothetical protein M0O54_10820 [Acinetobacter lactucae]|uniref:DUF4123 domain-containing protein n=1 Tax=Acinetobacter lactucae TaxID=1785128 RepID=A0AB35JZ10_9GAMM|nr:hypothetical protein [Acinetobacter lactucae]MDD9320605.1 hypothetical protein [Acinetobacter lactucae]
MSYFLDYDGNQWEKFCEIVIRSHYTQRYFTNVPADDQGDCGIEFFTAEGSIFQCYFPDIKFSMAEFKDHVQTKIRNDLKKLSTYEEKIASWLDGVKVHQWVLLVPEKRSKELITYCNKYKKITVEKNLAFIDKDNFQVKIETPHSYPEAFKYALKYQDSSIHVPIKTPEHSDFINLQETKLDQNILRKSNIISPTPDKFAKNMTTKYLSMLSFLDELRTNYPDTYYQVEECGRVLLEKMHDLVDIEGLNPDIDFIKTVKLQNEQEIQLTFNEILSRTNLSQLSYGYISKWIAECNMDFINE